MLSNPFAWGARPMPIDLHRSLAWMNADPDETRMLRALRGNILKSHGRPRTAQLFFTIDPARRKPMR